MARRRVKTKSIPGRLDGLTERVRNLEKLPQTVQGALNALHEEIRFVRRRLAQFYPERHYCPSCKGIVHQTATACKACGHTWGKQPDPKAGLPR